VAPPGSIPKILDPNAQYTWVWVHDHGTCLVAFTEFWPEPEFWPDDVSYTDVPVQGVIGHRQVTGAYLAQLARGHGSRLATFDQALAKPHDDVVDLIPDS
jgi:predicted nucleic acid-binding protein